MKEEGHRVPEVPYNIRDMNVLNVIKEEDLTSFNFEGIKRRLRVHPETLSRILNRLVNLGLIEKHVEGYRVSTKIDGPANLSLFNKKYPIKNLVQTLLPPEISIHEIVAELKGKWFGVLRWLGYSEHDNHITLKWITEDGGIIISAHFLYSQLNIEAKMLYKKGVTLALLASYQLMGHITKLISRAEQN